jgi:hypothetical protein
MEYNGKHYYKIDVPGHYSFMTVCNDEIDELEVLHRAFLCDLFTDDDDVKYAKVDDLVSENDIEFFSNYTYDI